MKVDGFYINCAGDESVGIFSAEWKLTGEWYFDDEADLKNFEDEIALAFETHITGGDVVCVKTFQERKAEKKK